MKFIKKILIQIIIILIVVFLGKLAVTNLYPFTYRDIIEREAAKYNISPYLVAAVIKTESGFDSSAKSHKDAKGLMQLTDDTASDVAEQMGMTNFDVHDPETNIAMGCWYLNDLGKEFNGDTDLILAAYNAGRGNVQKWLNDNRYSEDGAKLHYIPFNETDKYIKKVKTNFNIYKFIYGKH